VRRYLAVCDGTGVIYRQHGTRRIGVFDQDSGIAPGREVDSGAATIVSGHVLRYPHDRTRIHPWLVSKKLVHAQKGALCSTHVSDDEGVCCPEQQ
jgi:hypothetical protein